jgi:hypothetical protein
LFGNYRDASSLHYRFIAVTVIGERNMHHEYQLAKFHMDDVRRLARQDQNWELDVDQEALSVAQVSRRERLIGFVAKMTSGRPLRPRPVS